VYVLIVEPPVESFVYLEPCEQVEKVDQGVVRDIRRRLELIP
jgi:hypothetical protein